MGRYHTFKIHIETLYHPNEVTVISLCKGMAYDGVVAVFITAVQHMTSCIEVKKLFCCPDPDQ